jgi:hypothetical protein
MRRITRVLSLIGTALILTLFVGPASADLISVDTIPTGGLAFLENTDGHEFLVQVRNVDVTQANVQITKVMDPEVTNTSTDGEDEDKVDNAHLFDRTECLVVLAFNKTCTFAVEFNTVDPTKTDNNDFGTWAILVEVDAVRQNNPAVTDLKIASKGVVVNDVPEPSSIILMLAGLTAFGVRLCKMRISPVK